jgi:hypothetical protein
MNVALSNHVARARTRLPAALEAPAIDLRITGVIREGSNAITPVFEGDELYVGDRLIGSYVAADRRNRAVRLRIQPSPHPRPGASSPTSVEDDARSRDGSWELHTANMRPCGYTLTLRLLEPTSDGSTRCCGSAMIDFRLEPRPAAAPSPRPEPGELTWKLTSKHDRAAGRAACQ